MPGSCTQLTCRLRVRIARQKTRRRLPRKDSRLLPLYGLERFALARITYFVRGIVLSGKAGALDVQVEDVRAVVVLNDCPVQAQNVAQVSQVVVRCVVVEITLLVST